MQRQIAIVTGANSGVGYAIVQRLAEESPLPLTVVLACRSKARAEEALENLKKHFDAKHQHKDDKSRSDKQVQFHIPDLRIELVDIGSVDSVLAFVQRIKDQFARVDYLFCNAGVLPAEGIRYSKIVTDLFTCPLDLVIRSDVLIQPKQHLTKDGIGNVFACNVFGHYMMIKGLEDQLNKTEDDPGRVIWTGSLTGEKNSYRASDWQGLESNMPYESSKWATDLLAIRLNEMWANGYSQDEIINDTVPLICSSSNNAPAKTDSSNGLEATVSSQLAARSSSPSKTTKKHIVSLSTQPGVVVSGIGNLPYWIILLRVALHYVVRFFGEPNQTLSGYHGAKSNVYVALKTPIKSLDYRSKYGSCVKSLGKEFLRVDRVSEYDESQARHIVAEME
ncbi:hypothetical protein BGW38_003371, partial [Lunasporangiospora selenospora]